eukprot:CAMPEP_0168251038 /NCGR_PEP_ID=MMETSP0141_2-20121125/2856_1 /TAXON_ID=44445 /ORGANISM="Pseudo-nitzschia australis, Strain 10249 10 AB" /LENGTH=153 /DNA_ID=CAMNT_0008187141 /DNA_START=41 /DNA_END=502 /DNA_ORIENTATION=+
MSSTTLFVFWSIVLLQQIALHDAHITVVDRNEIEFPWCIPETSYAPQAAKEGDTVTFSWDGAYHNVYIYPSGICTDKTDRTYLGESTGASYTFTKKDVGKDVTFVCDVGGHCASGQIVTFSNVVSKDSNETVPYSTNTPCGDVLVKNTKTTLL